MVDYAVFFKQLRESYGLTQKQMSERLGISRGTWSNYESGMRSPSIDVIKRVSSEFHVPMEYLLDLSGGESVDISCLYSHEQEFVRRIVSWLYEHNHRQ